MATKLNYMALVLVGLLVGGGLQPFTAAPQAQNPDTLAALLVEVKGLRVAMEQLASAGPRVQLLFGRLQLQEQRINASVRKLEALQSEVKAAADKEARQRAELQRLEDFVRNNPGSHEREDLERSFPGMRKHLASLAAETQRLQIEEVTLSGLISTEQNRWNDINRALDELDRALTRR
jgi:hypothetical protein